MWRIWVLISKAAGGHLIILQEGHCPTSSAEPSWAKPSQVTHGKQNHEDCKQPAVATVASTSNGWRLSHRKTELEVSLIWRHEHIAWISIYIYIIYKLYIYIF